MREANRAWRFHRYLWGVPQLFKNWWDCHVVN